ncbi:alpha/beta hydrolase [Pseudarthrobacter sp. N5]|uniref:alpha/beta hydrolase n=1 Tax=Pseudarthrobacter sp. N5 TaxID=3418416 RepID=UPI003CF59F84
MALSAMDLIADLRLTDGLVLWTAWVAGAAGFLLLLRRPDRLAVNAHGRGWIWRWAAVILLTVIGAAGIVAAVHWSLVYVFSVYPGELPTDVLAWTVPPVEALLLWLLHLRGTSWPRRVSRFAAVLGVLFLSAVQINAYFGLNRTVSDLLGTAVARVQPLEPALLRQTGTHPAVPLKGWEPLDGLPSEGLLRKATIPGVASGFSARDAYVYLPPAYSSVNRPQLPVLVLFSGQPGGPADWLSGGALRSQMDSYASRHGGISAIVIVVDPNGSESGNSLCMDSRIAQADTYLSSDVPRWISETLDVVPDHADWAVGGFSFGATCALQMATRHPDIYRSVIAFSSELEPALAKERQKTIDIAFAGDTAAFDRQTPLNVMKQGGLAGSVAYFGAGERDPEFRGYMEVLARGARSAGMTVEAKVVENTGHSWDTPATGMESALDFLSGRWGLQQ